MQQIYVGSYIRGYNRLMKYIADIEHLSQREKKEIERRLKIIGFFEEYGAKATRQAFEVGRSTVYLWKKTLKMNKGRLSCLKPGSRAPIRRRRRQVDTRLVGYIREYRQEHPGTGKSTIHAALKEYCRKEGLRGISESSVGRVLCDLKARGQLNDRKSVLTLNGLSGRLKVKLPRKKSDKKRIGDLKAKAAGDIVQIDAVTVFVNSVRRYLLTAIDIKTRFAFSYSYKSLSRRSAKDFMDKLQKVAPFEIKSVQTDNGSEFHKHFRKSLESKGIEHYFNYPRSPKSNCYMERFNRTIQEQYVNWNKEDLYEPEVFNYGLMDYLLWYNTEKPHRGLPDKQPPLRYLLASAGLELQQSNMLWISTTFRFKNGSEVTA
ncbi:MAG: DDE-type integrase/transposase/recombinase [bacterium]